MAFTTYSFANVNIVISGPIIPTYILKGQALGKVNIEYDGVNSVQDRAADGSIMTSFIVADNGSLTFEMQQTSTLHNWLMGIFNGLYAQAQLDASVWTSLKIEITTHQGQGDDIIATGVCFEKRAGQPYEAQGQHVTWKFLAANLQFNSLLASAINFAAQTAQQVVTNPPIVSTSLQGVII